MDVNHHGVYVTFKELFRRIFEEGWEIPRYCSEKLLKFLADPNDDVAKYVLNSPTFSDLIADSFKNKPKLSLPNKTFMVAIFTQLFKNELQFIKLQRQVFDLHLDDNTVQLNNRFEYRLAFIKLATVLVTHTSGIKATLDHKPWELVPYFGLHHKPAHITKVFYEYLSQLVWKLDEYQEETILYEIIRAILKPIHMSEYQTLQVFDTEKEKVYSDSVKSPLHALLAILSKLDRLTNSKCLMPILNHCYVIEAPTQKLMIGTRDSDVIFHIAFIDFHIHCAILKKTQLETGSSESVFLNGLVVRFIRNISLLLSKKVMIAPIMEFILNVNICLIKNNLYPSKFEWNGGSYEIGDQFAWNLTIPMTTYVVSRMQCPPEDSEEYFAKISKLLTEHITKTGYWYRSILQRHDLKQMTIQNVKQVLKMQGLLKAKQAATVFQSLFYLLRTFVDGKCVINERGEMTPLENLQSSDDVKLLSLTMAAIKMLLTEHNINWYDKLEIICLHTVLRTIMEKEGLPKRQLLQALDLIEMSTRQFLSPDMTLLVEYRDGDTLSVTLAAMRRLISHEDWEVRDSALSLVLACIDVAFIKYEPLQKLILKNELLVLASEAALSDSEYYVQVSALRCLAAATKVETMWRAVIGHNPRIYMDLIQILRQNSDSSVRTAAAKALTQIYINQYIDNTYHKCMCDVMLSAALDEPHWDVQLAALDFWKYVIRNLFIDRGMIDDKFPSVTFSKEKRKIIVLNEAEVKRQLAGAIHDLSANGCLTVLHQCLTEDYYVQVREKAYDMSKKLLDILNFHNFHNMPEDGSAKRDNAVDWNAEKEDVEMLTTETNDLRPKSKRECGHSEMEQDIPPSNELVKLNKFLETFKQKDYKIIIENIKNWKVEPQSLNDVLNQILEARPPHFMSTGCLE